MNPNDDQDIDLQDSADQEDLAGAGFGITSEGDDGLESNESEESSGVSDFLSDEEE